MTIFFQNLNEDIQQEIVEELKEKLESEIEEAIESGIDRETATMEIVDNHINTHNFGIELNY